MKLNVIQNFKARLGAASIRSHHQQRIDAMMEGADQGVPVGPAVPDANTRMLRARLIYEEAMETINALGVEVTVTTRAEEHYAKGCGVQSTLNTPDPFNGAEHEVAPAVFTPVERAGSEIDFLVDVADGCCDVSVVTIGTLTACGLADVELLRAVDENNLLKFAEGHTMDSGGKLIKPPTHESPDLKSIIEAQMPDN